MGLFGKKNAKKNNRENEAAKNVVKKNESVATVAVQNYAEREHHCPFCGYTITKDNILYVDVDQGNYQDLRKFSFLKLCSSQWNLGNQFTGYKTHGLYYRLQDVQTDMQPGNGAWPAFVRVRPCDGLTPTELENDKEWTEKLEDYIAQYDDKMSPTERTIPSTPSDTADTLSGLFSNASIASNPEETNAFVEEVKPKSSTYKILGEKACPNCHSTLHQDFGEIETISVTMFGGTSAGKTAFLLALTQSLKTQLSSRGLGTATLLPTSDSYYQSLYMDCLSANGTTATIADEQLFPFVFYYLNGTKRCFISFYDIAGENTQKTNALLNHRGITEASTMMLMIDPNQLNQGAYFNWINGTDSVIGSFNTAIDLYLSQTIAQNMRLCILERIRHVLVVLTKLDMPLECEPQLFEKPSGDHDLYIKYPLQPEDHKNGLNMAMIDDIRNELNIFLKAKLGHSNDPDYSFLREVANMFGENTDAPSRCYDLLGISTYTRIMGENEDKMVFQPDWRENSLKHRVIEPFLVILARNGLINML